ncbi:MAG: alpha/beta fold hydrolase [Patescibacteria group bacterium]
MKRAVILHCFQGTSASHWYPWLKQQLENYGYEVWAPDMPHNHQPNARETTDFLLANKEWDFNDNLLIGHSWGAVQAMHLLQNLPHTQQVKTAVLVSAFTSELPDKFEWSHPLAGLFNEPFDYGVIKSKARKLLFIHGDNDSVCDPKRAEWLAQQVGGEYTEVPGGKHFSTSGDPSYSEFPALIKILKDRDLL